MRGEKNFLSLFAVTFISSRCIVLRFSFHKAQNHLFPSGGDGCAIPEQRHKRNNVKKKVLGIRDLQETNITASGKKAQFLHVDKSPVNIFEVMYSELWWLYKLDML